MYNKSAIKSKSSRPTHEYIQHQQQMQSEHASASASASSAPVCAASCSSGATGGGGCACARSSRNSARAVSSSSSSVSSSSSAVSASSSTSSLAAFAPAAATPPVIDFEPWKKKKEEKEDVKVEGPKTTSSANAIDVIIKFDGRAFMVSIDPGASVKTLKEKIASEHSELKVAEFRMVIDDKPVEDESKTLDALKVGKEAILHAVAYDNFGNERGTDFDLGEDGAFGDFSVLFGCFYHETHSAFKSNAGAALHQKGFRLRSYGSGGEDGFTKDVQSGKWDVLVIVADSRFGGKDQAGFVKAVVQHHNQGKGLMVFGDNDPYNVHANLILETIAECKLSGCDPAQKQLLYGKGNVTQQFDQNHNLFVGVNALYEGHTICVPSSTKRFEVVATSSDKHPCIMAMESGRSGDKKTTGRVVVDTGFTKLYMQWTTAGQSRYIVNSVVWLIDLESRGLA